MSQTRLITQSTLAELAGVSVATVSRALADDPRISPEVISSVKKLARKYDYRPSAAARSFVTRRTNTVGFVVIDRSLKSGVYAPLAEVVEQAVSEAGMKLQLARWDSSLHQENELPPIFRDDGLDGVILAGMPPTWLYKRLVGWNMPTVVLGSLDGVTGVSQITGDCETGARLAAEHLLSLGHRNVGVLIGPRDRQMHQAYYRGFRDTYVKAGVPARTIEATTIECPFADVVEQVRDLMSREPKITAIFCDTDFVSWQAIQILRAMGYDVPKQISVVGVGGWIADNYVPVKITTVDVQLEAMGRAAARLLVDHIKDKSLATQRIVVEPQFRAGQTTDACHSTTS